MPHSSGGGSHGGGSHGGGSHGSSKPSGVRTSYYPGSRRYVYYRNSKPNYIYSNYDPTKLNKNGIISAIIMGAIFSVFSILVVIGSFISSNTPLKTPYPNEGIVIEDRAGIFYDTEDLEHELQTFYEKTKISPTIITVNNEDWEDHYISLEKYAYEQYVTRYSDESHWVIVYSEPKKPDSSFNDWSFEGIQGDDTDNILSESVCEKFNDTVYTALLRTSYYSTENAIAEGFTNINKNFKSVRGLLSYVPGIIAELIIVGIMVGVVVLSSLPKKEYKDAMECPLEVVEEACDYCSGIYIVGQYTNCPHCGAPVKPHTYKIDEKGNRKVIQ